MRIFITFLLRRIHTSIHTPFMLIAALISCCLLLDSCDVHQFPEPKDEGPAPEVPVETVMVPLNLVYTPDFYVWEHSYDPILGKIEEANPELEIFPGLPGVSSKYDNTLKKGIMDVHVKAYLASNRNKIVKEQSFSFDLTGNSYATSLQIELPKDTEYKLGIWSHLRESLESNPFYDPSDFNRVSIIGNNYQGNTDYRDGFKGEISLETFSEKHQALEVIMTRPMGKFEFVTIDLSEFLDRETSRRSLQTRATADEYNVVISFPYYMPSSYSLLDDRLEFSASGVGFVTKMTVTGDSDASLGFEYVMLNNGDDGGVQARVDIYDPVNTHVAGSATLTIPMKRDHHTVLRGAFLSQEGEGGVGIDPDFDGDFNVPV